MCKIKYYWQNDDLLSIVVDCLGMFCINLVVGYSKKNKKVVHKICLNTDGLQNIINSIYSKNLTKHFLAKTDKFFRWLTKHTFPYIKQLFQICTFQDATKNERYENVEQLVTTFHLRNSFKRFTWYGNN